MKTAYNSTGECGKKTGSRPSVLEFREDNGFSLVEITIALMLACVLAGFAVINMNSILPGVNANGSMYEVIAQLRHGRQAAISQRRNIQLLFPEDNQIRLVRNELPNGETVLGETTFGNTCTFMQFDDVNVDTPDRFGNVTPKDFGGAATLTFMSDGMLVDQTGNPVNGTLFLGVAGRPETARAVTVLGATGRIRGYRWTGSEWVQ
jgi:prepilin-type N-terminal cleavage/methylation domain-containing protein